MAVEDSRDKGPDGKDLGQSFEAHSGNVGSAFKERNASPELLVHKKSHAALWVILVLIVLVAVFLVYYLTKPKAHRQQLRAEARMGLPRLRRTQRLLGTSMCMWMHLGR